MLTKEQIDSARAVFAHDLHDREKYGPACCFAAEGDCNCDPICAPMHAWRDGLIALAAYERMVAMADNYRTMTALSFEESRLNFNFAAAINRALEG
jgi:hypothetical protein